MVHIHRWQSAAGRQQGDQPDDTGDQHSPDQGDAGEAGSQAEGEGRAADELHLTQSALSQQVRKLESDGGVTLLHASKILEKLKAINEDQQAGINIIKRALQAPIRQIVANAGEIGRAHV